MYSLKVLVSYCTAIQHTSETFRLQLIAESLETFHHTYMQPMGFIYTINRTFVAEVSTELNDTILDSKWLKRLNFQIYFSYLDAYAYLNVVNLCWSYPHRLIES